MLFLLIVLNVLLSSTGEVTPEATKANHQCNICSKAFKSKSLLQQHLQKHSAQKFLCSVCGRNYSFKSALSRHIGKWIPVRRACAPYPRDCDSHCVAIAADGCVICKCPNTANSTTTQGSINGCPSFPKDCSSAGIDPQTGCVICNTGSALQQSSTTGKTGSGVASGTQQTGTGCPAYPKSCPMSCVSIDSMGCVLCQCGNTGLNNGTESGKVQLVNGSGCRPFDESSCKKDCIKHDSDHCLVCNCSGSTGSGKQNNGGQTSAGGCPPFDVSTCNIDCVEMDSMGCLSCNCKPATTANTQANTGNSGTGSGTVNGQGSGGCPPFDVSTCDMSCVSMDASGCLSCSCPKSTESPVGTTASVGKGKEGQGAGGCSPFDVSACAIDCVSMDSRGCLSCTCKAPTGLTVQNSSGSNGGSIGSQNAGGCPPFDVSTCDLSCVVMSANGCLSCTCPLSTATPKGNINTTVSTSGSGSENGAGGCPSFDVSKCDMDCVVMDSMGCLSCKCAASTASPAVTKEVGSVVVSMTTNGPQVGKGAGGCPQFDASTCMMSCVSMDSAGCLSCKCPATTVAPVTLSVDGTTKASVSGQNAGGCPPFDASNCDTSCVAMDSTGCLSCHCPVTTAVPDKSFVTQKVTTSVGPGSAQGAGGCPTFDLSSCDPGCVAMDSNGCLSCNCPLSTAATSYPTTETVMTPSPKATTIPSGGNNGGCPLFNANDCEISCQSMDAQGCLHCKCSNRTSLSVLGQGILGGGSSGTSSNNGGCRPVNTGCDLNCLKIDSNGCVICKCSVTSATTVTTTKPTTNSPTTTTSPQLLLTTDSNVCQPIRCVAPCDVGITFGPDKCPRCKCRN